MNLQVMYTGRYRESVSDPGRLELQGPVLMGLLTKCLGVSAIGDELGCRG